MLCCLSPFSPCQRARIATLAREKMFVRQRLKRSSPMRARLQWSLEADCSSPECNPSIGALKTVSSPANSRITSFSSYSPKDFSKKERFVIREPIPAFGEEKHMMVVERRRPQKRGKLAVSQLCSTTETSLCYGLLPRQLHFRVRAKRHGHCAWSVLPKCRNNA